MPHHPSSIAIINHHTMKYELVREIFNLCSGNQMRDVFVSRVESGDLDEYVQQYLVGGDVRCETSVDDGGSVIYDIEIDGLKQRLSFTPDD
jgi:hypothetical protein